MPAFSFLHAADLHIGSPFSGIGEVSEQIRDVLIGSTFQAFDNMVRLAVSKKVNFLVLSGDLFDCTEKNLRAFLRVRKGMNILEEEGISVFIVHGNHDPLDEISGTVELPGNCHVFPGEDAGWQTVMHEGEPLAAVFGISFQRRAVWKNLAREVPGGPSDIFRIAMLHCTVGKQAGHDPYAPCNLSDLSGRHPGGADVDYWALGHVHTGKILSTQPLVVYPGVLQGRNFREQGKKGAFLVRVSEDREAAAEFQPLDVIRWTVLKMDVGSMSNLSDLMDEAWHRIETEREKAAGRTLVLRVCLTGRSELAGNLGRENVLSDMLQEFRDGLSDMDPPVWLDSIRNYSRRPVDLEARRQAGDLVGILLRETERMRQDPQLMELARKDLFALFGNRRFRAELQQDAASVDMNRLLEEAELLLLDLFEGN